MNLTGKLGLAVKAWERIVGVANVIYRKESLLEYSRSTFPVTHRLLAVIRPESTKEVQECLKVANKYRIPIYPISTGRNWGYGSQVPTSPCAILKLDRMNKITGYDEDLSFVTVGPGVTFSQLYRFLESKNSGLILSNFGGSPESSLVGNLVERGIGSGAYGNRYETAADLEIVLPGGQIIHSGTGNFPKSEVINISREGLGPEITGLFTQSNLGIVTRATVWLMKRPELLQSVLFYFDSDRELSEVMDKLRQLKSERVIEGNFLISNIIRQIAKMTQYPWRETRGRTPLPGSVLDSVKKRLRIEGDWSGRLALYAPTKKGLEYQRERITQVLRKSVRAMIFLERQTIPPPSTTNSTRSMYWRKKMEIPEDMDPDRDRCGGIWISPMVPFTGRDIVKATRIIGGTMRKFGFEANMGINCISERKTHVTGAIIYDRDVEGEDAKAVKCHDGIMKLLLEKGYIPYRLGIQSMYVMKGQSRNYRNFLSTLKKAVDPNGIISPGRYI